MNREEFISKIASVLSAESGETNLAFGTFLQKISDSLDVNESIRIPGLGIFQLKKKNQRREHQPVSADLSLNDALALQPAVQSAEQSYYLLFMPAKYENKEEGKALCFKLLNYSRNSSDVYDAAFDISVKKPLIPVRSAQKKDLAVQSSYILMQKNFEERTDELLSRAVRLKNFNVDYHRVSRTDELPESGVQFNNADAGADFLKFMQPAEDKGFSTGALFATEGFGSGSFASDDLTQEDITPDAEAKPEDAYSEDAYSEPPSGELPLNTDEISYAEKSEGLDDGPIPDATDDLLQQDIPIEDAQLDSFQTDEDKLFDEKLKEALSALEAGQENSEDPSASADVWAEEAIAEFPVNETAPDENTPGNAASEDAFLADLQMPGQMDIDESFNINTAGDTEDMEHMDADEMKEIEDLLNMYKSDEEPAGGNADEIAWQLDDDQDKSLLDIFDAQDTGKDATSPEDSFMVDSYEKELQEQQSTGGERLINTETGEDEQIGSAAQNGLDTPPVVSLDDYELRKSRKFSPLFIMLAAAFVIITAAGGYYFLVMKRSGAAQLPQNSASPQVKTQVIERQYDVPVTVVSDNSEPAGQNSNEKGSEEASATEQEQSVQSGSQPEGNEAGVVRKASDVDGVMQKLKSEVKKNETENKTPQQKAGAERGGVEKQSNAVMETAGRETQVSENIFSDGKKFTVQLSSWRTRSIAEREVERLKKSGQNAFISVRTVNNKPVWYRVRVGNYPTLKDAQAAQKKIK